MMNDYELASQAPIGRNWTAINRANRESNRAHARHTGILEAVNEVRRRQTLASEGNFPFRMYNPHPSQLPAGFDMSTLWRTFLVRCGRIDGDPLQNPTGGGPCDGFDENPDDDYFPQEDDNDDGDAVQPITITAGVDNFYFWSDTAVDKNTNPDGDPTIKSGYGTPTNWPGFPAPTGTQVLIGMVDTTQPGLAIVRQILRTDYVSSSGRLARAQIVAEQDNTLTVYLYDSGTDLDTSVLIVVAKPFTLRRTTYEGKSAPTTGFWAYRSKNTRTNNNAINSTGDIIYPPYTVGADLYISQCTTDLNVFNGKMPATYLDENTDGRTFQSEITWCGGQFTLMSSPFYTTSLLT